LAFRECTQLWDTNGHVHEDRVREMLFPHLRQSMYVRAFHGIDIHDADLLNEAWRRYVVRCYVNHPMPRA
jgi:hypothetical protein